MKMYIIDEEYSVSGVHNITGKVYLSKDRAIDDAIEAAKRYINDHKRMIGMKDLTYEIRTDLVVVCNLLLDDDDADIMYYNIIEVDVIE